MDLMRSRNVTQKNLDNYTSVSFGEAPHHEVRYTSGRNMYVEELRDGYWLASGWNASGHIEFPGTGGDIQSFGLSIGSSTRRDQPLAGWKWVSGSETPESESAFRHVVVELTNESFPLSVLIHTLLDGTPVVVRWLEIRNDSDTPLPLSRVEPFAGKLWREDGLLGLQGFTLGHFASSNWGCEGWLDWRPIPDPKAIPDGRTSVRSDRGQGHDAPFFIVRNEKKGEYFIGHLAWSANWLMEFEHRMLPAGTSDSLVFRVGPWASSAQRVVAPGETVTTPPVHLGHSDGDLDATVQMMHEHLRRSVLPRPTPERAHRVQLLVPADQGFVTGDAFNEQTIRDSVDVAATLGSEVFTLDAGWWDITGDWYPSKQRFPDGLGPVRDYVHERGLLFGLYIEAEGGRGSVDKSAVGRAHPDWLGPHGIINLSIPDAADWMESEICRVIDEYGPDLYRLDYNPQDTYEGHHTQRDGVVENDYWRYYDAFHATYDRVRAKYPGVVFQQCAAGGARNDLGTAAYFHETYLTDGLWMPHVLRVYAGQTLALPPENLVVAIGAPGWKGPLETYLRATFTLSTPLIAFGPAPTVDALNPFVRDAFLRYARIYKEFIRPLLPTCRMHHHAPVSSRGGVESSGWFAVEFASPDRSRGWATIIRTGATDSDTFGFVPRGLDPAKTYRVTFDSMDSGVTMSDLELMRDGVPLRLEAIMSSELLLFETV